MSSLLHGSQSRDVFPLLRDWHPWFTSLTKPTICSLPHLSHITQEQNSRIKPLKTWPTKPGRSRLVRSTRGPYARPTTQTAPSYDSSQPTRMTIMTQAASCHRPWINAARHRADTITIWERQGSTLPLMVVPSIAVPLWRGTVRSGLVLTRYALIVPLVFLP